MPTGPTPPARAVIGQGATGAGVGTLVSSPYGRAEVAAYTAVGQLSRQTPSQPSSGHRVSQSVNHHVPDPRRARPKPALASRRVFAESRYCAPTALASGARIPIQETFVTLLHLEATLAEPSKLVSVIALRNQDLARKICRVDSWYGSHFEQSLLLSSGRPLLHDACKRLDQGLAARVKFLSPKDAALAIKLLDCFRYGKLLIYPSLDADGSIFNNALSNIANSIAKEILKINSERALQFRREPPSYFHSADRANLSSSSPAYGSYNRYYHSHSNIRSSSSASYWNDNSESRSPIARQERFYLFVLKKDVPLSFSSRRLLQICETYSGFCEISRKAQHWEFCFPSMQARAKCREALENSRIDGGFTLRFQDTPPKRPNTDSETIDCKTKATAASTPNLTFESKDLSFARALLKKAVREAIWESALDDFLRESIINHLQNRFCSSKQIEPTAATSVDPSSLSLLCLPSFKIARSGLMRLSKKASSQSYDANQNNRASLPKPKEKSPQQILEQCENLKTLRNTLAMLAEKNSLSELEEVTKLRKKAIPVVRNALRGVLGNANFTFTLLDYVIVKQKRPPALDQLSHEEWRQFEMLLRQPNAPLLLELRQKEEWCFVENKDTTLDLEEYDSCSRTRGVAKEDRLTKKRCRAKIPALTPEDWKWVAHFSLRSKPLDKRQTISGTDDILFNSSTQPACDCGGLVNGKQVKFANSGIHSCGLFALENIKRGDLVIEYVGEIVRQKVADRREQLYERQAALLGRSTSSYLFRIDEELIVDATRIGNMARFINHSCDPNCTAQVVPCGSELTANPWLKAPVSNGIVQAKHIGIYADRDIAAGEEITYDYKFEFEEDELKISCFCGAQNCRGSLN